MTAKEILDAFLEMDNFMVAWVALNFIKSMHLQKGKIPPSELSKELNLGHRSLGKIQYRLEQLVEELFPVIAELALKVDLPFLDQEEEADSEVLGHA